MYGNDGGTIAIREIVVPACAEFVPIHLPKTMRTQSSLLVVVIDVTTTSGDEDCLVFLQ